MPVSMKVLSTLQFLVVIIQELKAFAFSWRHCNYSLTAEAFCG